MATNSGTQGMVDHRQRAFLCLGLPLLLVCGALLTLQLGCQKTASDAETAAIQAEPEPTAEPSVSSPPPATTAAPREAPPETAEPPTQASEPEVVEARPRIEMDKTVHDFGQIGPETKQTAQFKFKNAGSAPLKIVRVKSCCGVVTRGVSSGQEYAPGQTGTLELDYRAGSLPGSMERKLYIQSNDPVQSTVTMTIKATIVRRVNHEPQRLKLFLNRDNAGCEDITLTSLDGKPFSIKGFRSTANAITAQFDPTVKATKFVLKPQADMTKLQRNLKGQISIDLTHPEAGNVRLLYDVLPEFTISPPQIMVFNLKPDEPVQREIWILSNYRDTFEIESVSSQKGSIKLVNQKKVGNRYQLRIEITAPPAAGDNPVLSDVLQVKIAGGDTLSIQCRGFYARK